MGRLGAASIAEVIRTLQDRSQTPEIRETAAEILRALTCRDAVLPLIDALAEGEQKLTWMCMSALIAIGSRRHARRLMQIVRGRYTLFARQEAIYALWWLRETRAEPLFIQVSSALQTEEEYTRDMATEALGNTSWRPRTQRALAARLFDPSVSVRYAALCACPYVFPGFLRRALEAKLKDPGKVDDNRVIAERAAEILADADRACASAALTRRRRGV
jgi:HEAT repeat protein